MGIFFQSLKSATEFRALTWVLPSVWHILPIFLLFGELLTLQVSADLSFPNPQAPCPSELWLFLLCNRKLLV